MQGKKKERAAHEEEEQAAQKLLNAQHDNDESNRPILQAAHESGQLDVLGDIEDEDVIF